MTVKSKDWVQCGDVPDDAEDMGISDVIKKGRTFWINHYFENDTCIYLTCKRGRNICNILYNKQTQAVYRYQSMKNDIEYNAETNNEFSTRPVQLRSVDSKFAYNLHFMTNTMHICYEENMLSPNLVKQFETLNLPEEGFVVTEYKLK